MRGPREKHLTLPKLVVCKASRKSNMADTMYAFSLTTKADKVPAGSEWLHEIKHDSTASLAPFFYRRPFFYGRPFYGRHSSATLTAIDDVGTQTKRGHLGNGVTFCFLCPSTLWTVTDIDFGDEFPDRTHQTINEVVPIGNLHLRRHLPHRALGDCERRFPLL